MASPKSSFLDKVLGRLGRLDKEGLQTVVERLAQERSFLETLFNTIEDGVLVLDETGRILYFNQAVTRLLGLQESAEGQFLTRFVPELEVERFLTRSKTGRARVTRHELEITYPQRRFLSLYAAPLDGERSGGGGLALICHDATEAREKTFAAIESERAQALTLLAASVAHEIGNPLNALHIHLQLMEREVRRLRTPVPAATPRGRRRAREPEVAPGPEPAMSMAKLERYLGVAKGEITRLDYIITQFLQAIRPVPPQLRLASLNEVARETIELLRPELENRGLMVMEKLAPHLPHSPLDPAQLKQALVNLCKNAMQAMTGGGTLTVQTDATSDAVWISISDTGSGIPPEVLTRIFEPFYTTKKKGSGLGLMIVQRIVREHGGRIELESRAGRGTTFRVWLPLREKGRRLLAAGKT
jgi:two-component system, sporulation sensor kinase E